MAKTFLVQSGIAHRINQLHSEAISAADQAVVSARQSVEAVIRCGELLMDVKTKCNGEFELWAGANLKFNIKTAYNYMRCAKRYLQVLADGSLDFQTVKQLYIACGILPEPDGGSASNPDSDPFVTFWSMTKKLEHWLPRIEDKDKPRLREWWTTFGKQMGWL